MLAPLSERHVLVTGGSGFVGRAALREGGGLVETEVGIDTSLVDVTFGIVVILAAASLYVARRRWRLSESLRLRSLRRHPGGLTDTRL